MKYLRCFKETMISYGMHSPMENKPKWATQNKIIPHGWKGLVTAVLEAGPQLQWLTRWREEASNIEQ